jgi:hypothetical protein
MHLDWTLPPFSGGLQSGSPRPADIQKMHEENTALKFQLKWKGVAKGNFRDVFDQSKTVSKGSQKVTAESNTTGESKKIIQQKNCKAFRSFWDIDDNSEGESHNLKQVIDDLKSAASLLNEQNQGKLEILEVMGLRIDNCETIYLME